MSWEFANIKSGQINIFNWNEAIYNVFAIQSTGYEI